ncbi:hypothetical protein NKG05_04450 [Oerskovia sp. M15]
MPDQPRLGTERRFGLEQQRKMPAGTSYPTVGSAGHDRCTHRLSDRPRPCPSSLTVASTDPARRLDWRRLRGRQAVFALFALTVGAVGGAFGTVVAGRLAADPTTATLQLLAAVIVSAALLDTIGQVVWAGVVDRAEGRLRGDLLSAALHQPLATLTEQAVGEVLDRVDDDTHAVGTLVRRQAWGAAGRSSARSPCGSSPG